MLNNLDRRLLRCIGGLLLAAGLLLGCQEPPAPRSRQEALPPDLAQIPPEHDWAPPVLHAGGWLAPVPVPGAVDTAWVNCIWPPTSMWRFGGGCVVGDVSLRQGLFCVGIITDLFAGREALSIL